MTPLQPTQRVSHLLVADFRGLLGTREIDELKEIDITRCVRANVE